METRVAIVTGAASGIGRAVANRFRQAGGKLVLTDISQTVETALGNYSESAEVKTYYGDLTEEKTSERVVETAMDAFGRVDVLVNSAGVAGTGNIMETPPAEWDRLLAVNLKSVYLMSRATVPALCQSGGGIIVNIASELGIIAQERSAAYCAAKSAVIHLTKAMALDLGELKIRVNCVSPGPVATPLLESFMAHSRDPAAAAHLTAANSVLKRIAQPDEIASVVNFLASNESSYMTGSNVLVDGGCTVF